MQLSPQSFSHPPIIERHGIRVDVVRSLDQLMAVMAVRSKVFLYEQDCPYEEEFDGNDLSGALHLLAMDGNEPIGTMRLRFFRDFAKSERFAVVKGSRGRAATFAIIDAGNIIVGRKGYDTVIGTAQVRVAPFWERTGQGEVRRDRPSLWFSDHEYVEMVYRVSVPDNALTMDADAMVIARPEGDWDRQGILEKSARRSQSEPKRVA